MTKLTIETDEIAKINNDCIKSVKNSIVLSNEDKRLIIDEFVRIVDKQSDYFEKEDLKNSKISCGGSDDLEPQDLEKYLRFNQKQFKEKAGCEVK